MPDTAFLFVVGIGILWAAFLTYHELNSRARTAEDPVKATIHRLRSKTFTYLKVGGIGYRVDAASILMSQARSLALGAADFELSRNIFLSSGIGLAESGEWRDILEEWILAGVVNPPQHIPGLEPPPGGVRLNVGYALYTLSEHGRLVVAGLEVEQERLRSGRKRFVGKIFRCKQSLKRIPK